MFLLFRKALMRTVLSTISVTIVTVVIVVTIAIYCYSSYYASCGYCGYLISKNDQISLPPDSKLLGRPDTLTRGNIRISS
jgi:hypothetical protein